jgi:hypothetical protein
MQIQIWVSSAAWYFLRWDSLLRLLWRLVQPTFPQPDTFSTVILNNAKIARYGRHDSFSDAVRVEIKNPGD